MLRITEEEVKLLLDSLAAKYGPGYSDIKAVGSLQAKLSIVLEAISIGDGVLLQVCR